MTDPEADPIRPISALNGVKPIAPAWFEWAISQPSQEATIDVAGAAIRFSAWGEVGAPGLLFVHGGRAHRNWWRPFAPYFSGRFRVAAFDLSGMGDSEWREEYPTELFVEELFAVAQAAKLFEDGLPIVIGHSFGGWMTLAAVEKAGQRLGGAVVIDSPFGVPDPDEGYTVKLATDPGGENKVRSNKIYSSLEEPISRFRFLPHQPSDRHYLVDYIAREGLRKVATEDGGEGWAWKFDPASGSNFSFHLDRDIFLAARCPLAFIYGEKSAFAHGDGFDNQKRQCKGRSPFIVMPTVHHHLMMEEPMAFIATLKTLLTCWPVRIGV